MRLDNRASDQLRPISFEVPYLGHHPGSVLVSYGNTRVWACATWENKVPPHRISSGGGWITAEYGMLPGSTLQRKQRPGSRNGSVDGRGMEIQRLIGRSLRQAINIDTIGPITITVDCDVLQADGGTRTAAITGGWLALALCAEHLISIGQIKNKSIDQVMTNQIAAVSVGIVKGEVLTDLCYEEDIAAQTDANIVACADGRIVEFQCTAERKPMQREQIDTMLDYGTKAVRELLAMQQAVLQSK